MTIKATKYDQIRDGRKWLNDEYRIDMDQGTEYKAGNFFVFSVGTWDNSIKVLASVMRA